MKLFINNKPIIDIDIANNFISRIKGLMFAKNIKKGLLIIPTNFIHTFFMRESIDVIYIDKNSKIIKITESMKPWKIGPIIWNAKAVIELPAGYVNFFKIKVNDLVEFF